MHFKVLFNFPPANQCILGGPRGEHVTITGYTQTQVKGKEVSVVDAGPLALRLMDLFFSREEMVRENCTDAEGRNLLEPEIICK